MKVELFGERDLSVYFDLFEKYHTHFDPENPAVLTEEARDFYLSHNDLTDFTKDFLVLTEENVVYGVAGLLRPSSSENWSASFVVSPNSVTHQDILMLFEKLLQLVQKSVDEFSFVSPSDYQVLNEIVQSKGFSPIEYNVDLLVDFEKYQYSPNRPKNIVIQPQQDIPSVQEEEEIIRIYNEAFVNHFGFEPLTLESPVINFSKLLIEKGESAILYAYLEDKIVGFLQLIFRSHKKAGELVLLGVDPRFQKKGIGTALLHQGIKYLQDIGRQSIILTGVFYSNPKALNLYLRLGCYKKPHSEKTIYKIS